jgi:hypothetical protein
VGVSGVPGIASQTVVAYAPGVQLEVNQEGVNYVSGLFSVRTEGAEGVVLRVPGRLTALRMSRAPEDEQPLVFTNYDADFSTVPRGVMWDGRLFKLKGKASVEALHPARADQPERLVSISGEADGAYLTSNLYDSATVTDSRDNIWQVANQDLADKRKMVRSIRVDPNRVGAPAYRATLNEAIEGLGKLQKGYDMLQSRQYTDEVLKRMLQSGTGIPRLDLATIGVISGETAVSFEPFQNWLGQGRVMCNLAYFTNLDEEPGPSQPWDFVLLDGWGQFGEDTRILVEEGDAVVQVRRNADSEWTLRDTHQFDLLAEVGFNPEPESAVMNLDVDVTGFLLRKAFQVIGQLSLGHLEIGKDSMTLVYHPESPSQTVATRFSSFLKLKQILTFPGRDDLLDKYRPDFLGQKTWEAMQGALDHMAQAVYEARIDQIDEFTLTLQRGQGNEWILFGTAASPEGRKTSIEYRAELDTDPLSKIWERIDQNRDAANWLDLELDIGVMGL